MGRADQILFATCAPGLEPVLHEELRVLKAPKAERQVGGVRFNGDQRLIWEANLRLRTAIRVLLRLGRFGCRDANELYRGVQAVDWRRFLPPGGTLAVDARSRDSELNHSQFVAQRVKDAVVDQLRESRGERPSVDRDQPTLRIDLHLYRDRATLSVDTSGGSLHKRGWRRAQGRAPLNECLAAGVVQLSGWDARSPLVDPFCGSGTILIEAAQIACSIAPGLFRDHFGFELWPGHDGRAYTALREAIGAETRPLGKRRIVGMDHDPERVEQTLENLDSAGIEGVTVEKAAALKFEPRPGWNAWIVTNPPYGERVGDEARLLALYRDFGALLREHCSGYQLALLSGNPRLAKALGLQPDERIPLANGGLECELLRCSVR
ncbi:THUMP domain-containing class I SAM-dependent RNA methyltransferase [Engelhardtia mirabilis]|uniref:Ribosomal RNA large subunit methyltransferase L n=1 Tax=Engelhardtia mirabilis TaxID=2528011 RepID=A0A518BDE6_9BACT|nr:Ribosomal RNA large subunit methyltransferase L [Planctomycetes bacterium Pla133]QDU99335.1 Ribosomal RNA large subunit methyltransferase L [Planctomycetes bacterium Pla86]